MNNHLDVCFSNTWIYTQLDIFTCKMSLHGLGTFQNVYNPLHTFPKIKSSKRCARENKNFNIGNYNNWNFWNNKKPFNERNVCMNELIINLIKIYAVTISSNDVK